MRSVACWFETDTFYVQEHDPEAVEVEVVAQTGVILVNQIADDRVHLRILHGRLDGDVFQIRKNVRPGIWSNPPICPSNACNALRSHTGQACWSFRWSFRLMSSLSVSSCWRYVTASNDVMCIGGGRLIAG